ncbi:MAG: CPBP family intramembrane metalloprotease [Ruminococcaceae bacterium]|nr:CPBP family intramembrane metalloprotease [Oscillospiraceae bacterium]
MKKLPPFENRMNWGRTLFGLIYLPIHLVLLPLLLPAVLMAMGITDLAEINVYYYVFSVLLILIVYFPYLRANFDPLAERFIHCLLSFLMALGIYYIGTVAVNLVVLGLSSEVSNPNDQLVMDLVTDNGAFRAAVIFMAPIVEEVLFRGALFGGLRKKSRVWAYILSMVIFALCHVWQYALVAMDWTVLIFVLQYLPAAFALAWAYERSNSIWVPIGIHMLINAMSITAADMLAEMV